MKVKLRIYELINQKGISLRELPHLTNIPFSSLKEMADQKSERLNFTYLKKIVETLDISDISKIVELIETTKVKKMESTG